MRITKFGHNCLLIEEGELRALTDPGSWNEFPDVTDLNCVLITHEHGDHVDIPQLERVLAQNSDAKVITHASVGKLLEEAGIPFERIEAGSVMHVKNVSIQSIGTRHAYFYGEQPEIRNTGFLIAERLFITGDALHDVPEAPFEILALPCGGPWMRLSEAIDYARALKPKFVIPVHDAMYIEKYRDTIIPRVVGGNLEAAGISFRDMKVGSVEEF